MKGNGGHYHCCTRPLTHITRFWFVVAAAVVRTRSVSLISPGSSPPQCHLEPLTAGKAPHCAAVGGGCCRTEAPACCKATTRTQTGHPRPMKQPAPQPAPGMYRDTQGFPLCYMVPHPVPCPDPGIPLCAWPTVQNPFPKAASQKVRIAEGMVRDMPEHVSVLSVVPQRVRALDDGLSQHFKRCAVLGLDAILDAHFDLVLCTDLPLAAVESRDGRASRSRMTQRQAPAGYSLPTRPRKAPPYERSPIAPGIPEAAALRAWPSGPARARSGRRSACSGSARGQ